MICRLHVSLLVEEFHLILMAMSSFLFGLVICINVSIPILDFFLWFPTVPKRYHLMSTAFEGLVPSRNNNTTRFTTISLLRIQQQPNLERCAYKIPFWSFLWTWHCPYHPCFLQQLQDDYNLSQYQCLAGATEPCELPNMLTLGNPKNRWHWSIGPNVGLLHEVTPRNLGGKSGTISLHINIYLYIHIWYVLTNYVHIYILIFVYVYIHMLPLLGVGKLIVYDLSMPERKHMPTVIWIVLIVPLSHMSHPISQAFGLWFSRLF